MIEESVVRHVYFLPLDQEGIVLKWVELRRLGEEQQVTETGAPSNDTGEFSSQFSNGRDELASDEELLRDQDGGLVDWNDRNQSSLE
tara:strand:- start:834 stop:1094 length:261 start_codon:yes stop_codon:yes gene_type:complete